MTEPFSRHKLRPGWIEVIAGCMFSGKTEELIRQIRRAELAKQKYQVFKPRIDTRYSEGQVASHDQSRFPSTIIESEESILSQTEKRTTIVGIDEAQFFNSHLVEVATALADAGKRVIVAGLDTDWRGRPFGALPALMAVAEVIRKQYAICVVCGEPATRTQRLVPGHENILVGSTEAYEARCRMHFDPELSQRLSATVNNNTQEPPQSSPSVAQT